MARSLPAWLLLFAVGCSGASATSEPQAATEAPAAESETAVVEWPADATLVSFSVPGMTCPQGCAPVVKETLEKLPGVVLVDVDFDSRTAKVAVEKDKTLDSAAAISALADAGFKDSTLKQ